MKVSTRRAAALLLCLQALPLGAQPSPIGNEDRDARIGLDPLRAVFQLN